MKPLKPSPICWTKVFLNLPIRIELHDPEIKEPLGRLLMCFPDAQERTSNHFVLWKENNNSWKLLDHDGEYHQSPSWLGAYSLINAITYHRLFPVDKGVYIYHCAAVRHRVSGEVLWLIGSSASGKSLLTLSLIAGGQYDYISEEAIGMDPRSGCTLSFPRPLRPRSSLNDIVDIVGCAPGWEVMQDDHVPRVHVIPPSHVICCSQKLPKPTKIVILQSSPGMNRSILTPVSPGFLLGTLMAYCVNQTVILNTDRINYLSEFIEKIDGFYLEWGDLASTVSLLSQIC